MPPWWRRRNEPRGFSADDLAEIDAALAQVDREQGAAVDALIRLRLGLVMRRGVPLRRVVTGGELLGLLFADGTLVHARGTRLGALGMLAEHARRGTVRIVDVSESPVRLTLEVPGGGTVTVHALGIELR